MIAAESELVSPIFRILHADEKTAVAVLTFVDNMIMGDHWRLLLVHDGDPVSIYCTVEVQGIIPEVLDNWLRLLASLPSVPNGFVEPHEGPTLDAVQSSVYCFAFTLSEDLFEAELKDLDSLVRDAESLPLSDDANHCLAVLAAKLKGLPGAAFFGLTDESVRLFRILLRRTNRSLQPLQWALYLQGALLALADLTNMQDIFKLVDICNATLEKTDLASGERAILYYLQGKLLLHTEEQESYERAVSACSQSYDAAQEMGESGTSFAASALMCLADAYSKQGMKPEEVTTLAKAIAISDEVHRGPLKIRLHDLPSSDSGQNNEEWANNVTQWYRQQQNTVKRQIKDRVIHLNPFQRTISNILVLRPLVTALTPSLPNRFVAPFHLAWRFQKEPQVMTFEETLSRALGHRFSFLAVGAEFEAFGVGRLSTLPEEEAVNPERWKTIVQIAVVDPILCPTILIYPSDSPGMQWELDYLASNTRAHQQTRLFLVPPDVDPKVSRSNWERGRKALESRGLKIPEWHPNGLVFQNDADGGIAMSETFEIIWDGRLAAWIETHVPVASTFESESTKRPSA